MNLEQFDNFTSSLELELEKAISGEKAYQNVFLSRGLKNVNF